MIFSAMDYRNFGGGVPHGNGWHADDQLVALAQGWDYSSAFELFLTLTEGSNKLVTSQCLPYRAIQSLNHNCSQADRAACNISAPGLEGERRRSQHRASRQRASWNSRIFSVFIHI